MAISQNVGVISFSLKPIIITESPPNSLIFWLAAATNIGMLIGALISGPIADQFGRRKTIITFTIIHVASTLLGGFSPTVLVLIGYRILVGVGVGGSLPIIAALVSEYSGKEVRGRNISLLESFWAYGWLIALLMAWAFLPFTGWRGYMIAAGLIAILFSLSLVIMPESQRYLIKIGKRDRAIELAEKYDAPLVEISSEKIGLYRQLSLLISEGGWKITLPLWVMWFIITMGYYGIFIWLPALVAGQTYEIGLFIKENFFLYLFIVTLAQIPGYYSSVLLIDKIGRKPILSIYLIMTGIASFFYAFSTSVATFILWGVVLSFFDLGAWAAIYTYTPEQYPTHIRGTGTSWAGSWGRVGGILGPMIVPLLGGVEKWVSVFIFFAVIHIIGGLVALVGREMKGREMPEITHT